jgi:ubiquinone/menaquinone biosynthesis C-methylase UbiE
MTLFDFLIQQSKKPSGYIGKIMLCIMNKAHKNIFKFGLENIIIDENSKLLDLGFGGGKILKQLSRKYKNIKLYGIDFSEEAMKAGIKNNKTDIANGKIMLLYSDIEKMPFSENYFDIITAFQTHYHWTDLHEKIKEIYRVLNENGQFIIVAEKYKVKYHMEKFKTEEEIKQLLSEIGFIRIEYQEMKGNMFMKGWK